MGLIEGYNPRRLEEAGWGILFPAKTDPAILDALKPLIEWRKQQAGERYKEYTGGSAGVRSNDTKSTWFARQGLPNYGPVNPDLIPYYLLLVGQPNEIDFRFQILLDVQYAVGRIAFDTPEEYANYARSVVEAEKQQRKQTLKISLFGTANPDDPATDLSERHLVEPLFEYLQNEPLEGQAAWQYEAILREEASKQRLARLLGGPETPALLLAAAHGMGFSKDDSQQLRHQGALLCQDWPGPRQWKSNIPESMYFSADDLPDNANLTGLIAFLFASYSAGTPLYDEFARQAFKDQRAQVAPYPFLARLPQRMLAHPRGGALAVIGMAELAWGYSFIWGKDRSLNAFESTFMELLSGAPVGVAFEAFNERYGEFSTELTQTLDDANWTKVDPTELAGKWTANNDAKNFILLGDPAVHLPVEVVEAPRREKIRVTEAVSSPARQQAQVQKAIPSPAEPIPPLREEGADEELLYVNGINGATGSYDLPPMNSRQLSDAIQGTIPDDETKALNNWWQNKGQANYGLMEGYDPHKLEDSGWGILFPAKTDPAILDALKPLMEWRKQQAVERYKEYTGGSAGVRPNDTKSSWLARQGLPNFGPVNPDLMPYYLLLVGQPNEIDFRFQTLLDVQYAVGRIAFDTPEEYANYARSVVEAEKQQLELPRKISLFGVLNPDDPATNLSAQYLVQPLIEYLQNEPLKGHAPWQFETFLRDEAFKQRLADLLGGRLTPALLFASAHGMSFPQDSPLQARYQGALLCQDWPGPRHWRGAIPESMYFSADDLSSDAKIWGSIAFLFSCYGAGTPQYDEFASRALRDRRAQVATAPFLSRLPQRMLAHPKGGALAVIGHVERAWGYSFLWDKGRSMNTYASTLRSLMRGEPVGYAFEAFNERYGACSAELNQTLDDAQWTPVDPNEIAGKWTANNDSKNVIILGDPAVRLMISAKEVQASRKEAPVEVKTPRRPTAVSLALRVVQARYGECLLVEGGDGKRRTHILFDGGPNQVYKPYLRPELERIAAQGGKLDLVVASHINEDRITGLLQMFSELLESVRAGKPALIPVGQFWFNAFTKLAPSSEVASGFQARMEPGRIAYGPRRIVELIGTASELLIPQNSGFTQNLVMLEEKIKPIHLGGMSIWVLGPSKRNLGELQNKFLQWEKKYAPAGREDKEVETSIFDSEFYLEEDAAGEETSSAKKVVGDQQANTTPSVLIKPDNSIANRSSIILLVENRGQRILLTGDATGDDIISGLETAGLLEPGRTFTVDILKIPHGGSARNSVGEFFDRVIASSYIISTDGKYGLPDIQTLEWLVDAAIRQGRRINIIATNPTKSIDDFLDNRPPEQNNYRITIMERGSGSLLVPAGNAE